MKKFFTSVLMLSIVFVSMNVFNSCKDHDEDEYNDLLININKNDADIRELISTNYNNLKRITDDLAEAQRQCQANCSTEFVRVNSMIANVNSWNKSQSDSLLTAFNKIASLESADVLLQSQIDGINNVIAGLRDSVNTNTSNISTLFALEHTLDSTVNDLSSSLTALQGRVDDVNDRIDSLKEKVEDHFVTIESNLSNVSKVANEALQRAQNDSVWIKSLETLVDDYNTKVNARIDSLRNAHDARLDSLAGVTTAISDALNSRVDSLAGITSDLADELNTARTNLEKADSLLNAQDSLLLISISNLNHSINNINNVKIPAIESKLSDLEAKDTELSNAITDLTTRVTNNEQAISELSDKIDDITDRLDNVDEALKSLITGIIVQGTYNPVFGSISLPVGINSNVLIAYYGTNDNPVVFPTSAAANYVKNSDVLTDADIAIISNGLTTYRANGNTTLFNATDDNAGTIYVTVNPNTVDFAGQKLVLVNSKDEESGIKLTSLKKETDTELMFGYTRSASNNGFYSAKASVSLDEIDNVKVNIESGLKDAFKNALNQRTAASVATLAGKLYNQFNGIAPANALKASWTDYNGEHSVYSQYGIAATAIKPLSFAFLENANYTKIPGYDRVWNFIDDVVGDFRNSITSSWPSISTLSTPTITQIDIDASDISDEFDIKLQFTLPSTYLGTTNEDGYLAVYYKDTHDLAGYVKAGKIVYDDATGEYVMTIEGADLRPEVHDLYTKIQTSINDAITDYNGQVADFVEDVNDLLDQINDIETGLTNATDNLENKLLSYLDKVNDKLCGVINNANARIQPVLVVSDNNGTHFGSKAKNAPSTVASASITLRPTTYTAEIVAPAFKKHVACTNVFKNTASAQAGDSECLAVLNAVNAQNNVNTVIEGNVRSIPVTLTSGYVYEFAYSALDYSGKISMHKYYVQY